MRDANNVVVAYAIFAGIAVFVFGLLIALKCGIDRAAAESAEDERRMMEGLRRAVRGFSQATQGFSAAVGDNVAAQERHREVLGSVGADLEALKARRRLH